MSRSRLRRYLGKRCNIYKASASNLPFENESYTLATAFETVYYWSDLTHDFAEIYAADDLKEALLSAGFSRISADEKDSWISVVGYKD